MHGQSHSRGVAPMGGVGTKWAELPCSAQDGPQDKPPHPHVSTVRTLRSPAVNLQTELSIEHRAVYPQMSTSHRLTDEHDAWSPQPLEEVTGSQGWTRGSGTCHEDTTRQTGARISPRHWEQMRLEVPLHQPQRASRLCKAVGCGGCLGSAVLRADGSSLHPVPCLRAGKPPSRSISTVDGQSEAQSCFRISWRRVFVGAEGAEWVCQSLWPPVDGGRSPCFCSLCFCLRGESSMVKWFQKQMEPHAVSHTCHAPTTCRALHRQAGAHSPQGRPLLSSHRGQWGGWDTDTCKLVVEWQSKLRSFCPPMGRRLLQHRAGTHRPAQGRCTPVGGGGSSPPDLQEVPRQPQPEV